MIESTKSSGNRLEENGFSLVELMVSLVIGALLIAGALTIFLHSRIAWQAVENLAGLEERLAFALTEIERDVLHAGNWGMHNQAELIAEPNGILVHCRGTDVSNWALNLATYVAATNGSFDLPCPAKSNHVSGSDTLSLRYAQPDPAAVDENFIRLASTPSYGRLIAAGDTDNTGDTLCNLAVRGWYLDRKSSELGLASLRRYTLTGDGLMQNQEIMPGIEDFQVSLGVDRDADGLIDGFVDADKADGTTAVLAVRVWLLARTAAPEPGHADSGAWRSSDIESAAPMERDAGIRRLSAQRTIWLRNRPGA